MGEKAENLFWNLDSAEATEECNDGDDCGNDYDDVGGRGVKADVELAVKIGQHRLRLDNLIQVELSEFMYNNLCNIWIRAGKSKSLIRWKRLKGGKLDFWQKSTSLVEMS